MTKKHYEVWILSSTEDRINERLKEAQNDKWELNGCMLLYRGRTTREVTLCDQPLKRKIQ
jgi:hypothetical protein